MKTCFALAVLVATAALGLAFGSSSRSGADPLRPSVVRFVNMNQIFETAERFREERLAMTASWEKWNTELLDLGKQGSELMKQIEALPNMKSAQALALREEFETLTFRAKFKREQYSGRKAEEQTRAILKWSEAVEIAISAYAKTNGIDVVLQNWVDQAGSAEKPSDEESYRRILYRPAVYLDPALDISKEIADVLK